LNNQFSLFIARKICTTIKMLKGKTAIITGSSSGIGLGIAVKYAELGCQITLHGNKNLQGLEDAKKQCIAKGLKEDDVLTIVGDISDDKIRTKILTDTVQKFGKIDILINNAGISFFNQTNLDGSSTLDAYRQMMEVNVAAVIDITQKAVPYLIKTKGNIINISSIAGCAPITGFCIYGMTKCALNHYTKCMAQELGPHGVRVNSINPGAVATPIYTKMGLDSSAMIENMAKTNPLGIAGFPEDIANAAVYLGTDQSKYVTGLHLIIDGGLLIKGETHHK